MLSPSPLGHIGRCKIRTMRCKRARSFTSTTTSGSSGLDGFFQCKGMMAIYMLHLDILQSYRQSGGVRFGIPKIKPSKEIEIREWRFIRTNPHDRCLDTGYLGIDLQVFMWGRLNWMGSNVGRFPSFNWMVRSDESLAYPCVGTTSGCEIFKSFNPPPKPFCLQNFPNGGLEVLYTLRALYDFLEGLRVWALKPWHLVLWIVNVPFRHDEYHKS